jgi:hypothetical protein
MNLRPPPTTNNLAELRKWCEELYNFLLFPSFEVIRFLPRAAPTIADGTVEGIVYQDDTGNVLKAHNGTGFTDCNT